MFKYIYDRWLIYNPCTKVIKEQSLYHYVHNKSKYHYQLPILVNNNDVVIGTFTTNPSYLSKFSVKLFDISPTRTQYVLFNKMSLNTWLNTCDFKESNEMTNFHYMVLLEYIRANKDKIVNVITIDEQSYNQNITKDDRKSYVENLQKEGIESGKFSKDSSILNVNRNDRLLIDKQPLNTLYAPKLLDNYANINNISSYGIINQLYDYIKSNNLVEEEKINLFTYNNPLLVNKSNPANIFEQTLKEVRYGNVNKKPLILPNKLMDNNDILSGPPSE